MNFALVEDSSNAIVWANSAFDTVKHEGFSLDLNFSAQINTSSTYEDFKVLLKSMTGPLILCIDRDLGFDAERTLAKDYGILDYSQKTGNVEEGITLALEAIRNNKISPLLIVVSSGGRRNPEAVSLLKSRVGEDRSDSVAVISAFDGWYFTMGSEQAVTIVRNACEQFQRIFGGISPLESVMNEIQKENPAEIGDGKLDAKGHNHAILNSLPLAGKLLKLSEHDVETYFPAYKTFMSEAFKELGLCPRHLLSIGSTWLIALSAYRYLYPAADWTTVFDPRQLTYAAFNCYSVLPPQRKQTLHSSIVILHTMFKQLFQKDDKHLNAQTKPQPNGPLLKATIGPAALKFELDFPFKAKNDAGSMAKYLCNLVGQETNGKAVIHGTTSSIWNFYLRSLLADNIEIADYQFPGKCTRMILQSGAGGTTTQLVFDGKD